MRCQNDNFLKSRGTSANNTSCTPRAHFVGRDERPGVRLIGVAPCGSESSSIFCNPDKKGHQKKPEEQRHFLKGLVRLVINPCAGVEQDREGEQEQPDIIGKVMGEEIHVNENTEHNLKHGITPTTTTRSILDHHPAQPIPKKGKGGPLASIDLKQIDDLDTLRAAIDKLRTSMKAAAADLDFELAATLRDEARKLEQFELQFR